MWRRTWVFLRHLSLCISHTGKTVSESGMFPGINAYATGLPVVYRIEKHDFVYVFHRPVLVCGFLFLFASRTDSVAKVLESRTNMDSSARIGGKRFPAYIFYDDNTARLERGTIHGNEYFWMGEAEKRKNYTEKMTLISPSV